jgi:undecaprenyl-diphosphatase
MVADGASLLHGRSGWRRAAARFLERAGVLPRPAQQAIDRFLAVLAVAAVLVALGTTASALLDGRLSDWDAPRGVLPAVAVGLSAWALVLLGQWLAGRQDRSAPVPLRQLLRALRRDGGRTAARALPQLGWAALAIVLEGAVLAAAVHAVGADVPVLATGAVYAAWRLVWTLVPVTGAPGAAELVLLLALSSLGATLADACAAILVFRLVTFWVPAAIGAAFVGRHEHRLRL